MPAVRPALAATVAAVSALVCVLAVAGPARAEAPMDAQAYWAFADRTQLRLDGLWSEQAGRYVTGSGGVSAMVNANLLLSHAVAALKGHSGPARDDARARQMARALLRSPPWVEGPSPSGGAQAHGPGWVNNMGEALGWQHLVVDAEIADGLAMAYRARHALGLPEETARAIADQVDRAARGPFWRWPALRLNQFNWHAGLYAAAHAVSGRTDQLRRDLRRQLVRFADGVRPRGRAAGNLGPGLRFHYLPAHPAASRMNLDSAEYANIVLSFARHYEAARRAGMTALDGPRLGLMRRWARRVLAGYWTHAGYLNWDTGLGFKRWHQAKKLGLAQQALIGLATAPSLQPSPAYGRWAKWLLDRGFEFYDRQAERAGGLAPGVLFGVGVEPQGRGSQQLAAARMQANAARAITGGLGGAAAEPPPPLYAYDPDTGRLAVTTRTYNTAIVPVNQGAFPYGGIELARLFDADQVVAATTGGRPPAAFGLLVRDVGGRRLLATQSGARRRVDPRVTPLRLTRAPAGSAATAATRSRRAYAGPFRDLRATGVVRGGGFTARSSHRFTADWIESRWAARRLAGRTRVTVDALFPSWGEGGRPVAVLADGRRVGAGARRRPLAGVAYFELDSGRSGYRVVPLRVPRGATFHGLGTRPQDAAPAPGRTLALQLARASRTGGVRLAVRVVPLRPRGGA